MGKLTLDSDKSSCDLQSFSVALDSDKIRATWGLFHKTTRLVKPVHGLVDRYFLFHKRNPLHW